MIPAPVGTSPGARRPGVRALDGARWSASAVRPRLEKARGLLRVSSPEGAGTAVLGGRAALGQPRPGDRAVGDYSQPAPRPTCPRRKAVVPKDASRPARTGNRSARWCSRLHKSRVSDSRGLPKEAGAHPRSGQLPRRAGDLSCRGLAGHGFAWSGLVCCASRGGARGQPVVPLRPSLRASRARSGGVFRRAPAWQSPSLLEGGGSPSRPVAAAPLSSVRHSALAGRAGTVRRLPEEAAGSGSCYRQGRTG